MTCVTERVESSLKLDESYRLPSASRARASFPGGRAGPTNSEPMSSGTQTPSKFRRSSGSRYPKYSAGGLPESRGGLDFPYGGRWGAHTANSWSSTNPTVVEEAQRLREENERLLRTELGALSIGRATQPVEQGPLISLGPPHTPTTLVARRLVRGAGMRYLAPTPSRSPLPLTDTYGSQGRSGAEIH